MTAPSRRAVVDALGLTCYIVWSFAFWNGPLLPFAETGGAGVLLLLQGVATALVALAIALGSGSLATPGRQTPLLILLACMSAVAVPLAAIGMSEGSGTLSAIGFALSGAGSCLRLGWEERISVQGVRATCMRVTLAYLCGYAAFGILMLLPHEALVAVAVLLPLASSGMLLAVNRAHGVVARPDAGDAKVAATQAPPTGQASDSEGIGARMGRIPWRLLVLVALMYFCYGAARTPGVFEGNPTASSPLSAGLPMVTCIAGIVLAYLLYCRRGVFAALYVGIPLVAVACVLNVLAVPFAGTAVFLLSNLGAELIKYLAWFLLIDAIIKDGASALACVALLRCAQWGGSALGQVAHELIPTTGTLSVVMLVALLVALLAVVGTVPLERFGGALAVGHAGGQADGSTASGTDAKIPAGNARSSRTAGGTETAADNRSTLDLQNRVQLMTDAYGLSPRESEVLAIWATGRSCAYLEKQLFISHGTAKTHLTHIYAKTHTANREELLELMDGLEKSPLSAKT